MQVRHTASSQRSREEKQWVAMDVLVNPQCYTHVTEIEADEMRFDDDYEVQAQKRVWCPRDMHNCGRASVGRRRGD